MKKFLLFAVVTAILLSLCACGKTAELSNTTYDPTITVDSAPIVQQAMQYADLRNDFFYYEDSLYVCTDENGEMLSSQWTIDVDAKQDETDAVWLSLDDGVLSGLKRKICTFSTDPAHYFICSSGGRLYKKASYVLPSLSDGTSCIERLEFFTLAGKGTDLTDPQSILQWKTYFAAVETDEPWQAETKTSDILCQAYYADCPVYQTVGVFYKTENGVRGFRPQLKMHNAQEKSTLYPVPALFDEIVSALDCA